MLIEGCQRSITSRDAISRKIQGNEKHKIPPRRDFVLRKRKKRSGRIAVEIKKLNKRTAEPRFSRRCYRAHGAGGYNVSAVALFTAYAITPSLRPRRWKRSGFSPGPGLGIAVAFFRSSIIQYSRPPRSVNAYPCINCGKLFVFPRGISRNSGIRGFLKFKTMKTGRTCTTSFGGGVASAPY